MTAGDTLAVMEARAEAAADGRNPLLAGPEWTMPAGRVTLLVALFLGACAVAGLLA